jgi:hypothetical protein
MSTRLALDPWWPAPTCSICGTLLEEPPHWRNDLGRLCSSCCGALRDLLRAGPAERIAEIWGREAAELSLPANAVADIIDIAGEATHADLATAYREMGLFGDAIRETLFVARGNAERPWHQALVILFAAEIAPDALFDTLNAVICRR